MLWIQLVIYHQNYRKASESIKIPRRSDEMDQMKRFHKNIIYLLLILYIIFTLKFHFTFYYLQMT